MVLNLDAGLFQQRLHLLPFHRGELLKKSVYSIAELEMVEERPGRHARSRKAGCAAKYLFINLDDFNHRFIIAGVRDKVY
jgi:hypothetical protein